MRKRCYYVVLELNLKATICEIRHSYHKLAMKWHPDKNKSNEAKDKFQEINEAYSILSDPGEKTWYDRHRETIIKNWNLSSPPEDMTARPGANSLTNGGNYWPYFVRPAYLGYDDSDIGFYTVYRNVFSVLGDGVEEMNALVNNFEETEQVDTDANIVIIKAPSFGNSETRLAKVARFYIYWDHLISVIEGVWSNLDYLNLLKDQEVTIEQRDWRKNIVETFIEVIKSLVKHVKTRDPRYHQYLQNKTMIDNEEEIDSKEEANDETSCVLCKVGNFEEIELCGNKNSKRKVCLECWNWAHLHLESIIKAKSKDILLEDVEYVDVPKIKDHQYDQFPAIEPKIATPTHFESSNSTNFQGETSFGQY